MEGDSLASSPSDYADKMVFLAVAITYQDNMLSESLDDMAIHD
jgi:hypothetical protein